MDPECHICCERRKYSVKYGCSHEICHKCAARLIYLYKDKRCPMCKYDQDKPVFRRSSPEAEDEVSKEPAKKKVLEDNFAQFENEDVRQRVKSLLVVKCKNCKEIFSSKKELIGHFKAKHSALLCSTCLENNHQFWYEFQQYTPETLSQHRRGQMKESGFEGHVHCPFCTFWLYNRDAAKKHCNQEHQLCTVCDSIGYKFQFYKNFGELEQHYRSRHYCCDNPVCVKNLCYVYAYKSEVCAHSMTHHGLDLQYSDITLKNEKNPQVFSLKEGKAEDEDESPYTRGVNILTPLVKTPFFPSFLQGKSIPDATAVPSFLNRQIVHEAQTASSQRLNILRDICPNFAKEISVIIEKYISGSKPLPEMVSEIEDSAGSAACLKILGRISFFQRQKEVSVFIEQYKKELKFPKFKKKSGGPAEESTPKSSVGFRVFDFSKNKR